MRARGCLRLLLPSLLSLLLPLLPLRCCSGADTDPPPPGSTRVMRSCYGVIESHANARTAPLPPNLDLQWVLWAMSGNLVRLRVVWLRLEMRPNGVCVDHLSVRSGSQASSGDRQLCGVWDGLEILGGGRVTLRLRTGPGASRPGHGFRIEYECVRAGPTAPAACPRRFACSPEVTAGLRLTQCLPNRLVCDGRTQCRAGEDEFGCANTTAQCPPYQVACKGSRQCIPHVWRCDGFADCPHGDDEDCGGPATCAKVSDFRCGPDLCIPGAWVCDGTVDCENGADEKGCTTTPPLTTAAANTTTRCPRGSVRCPNEEKCLRPSQLCDGRGDCKDRSDEAAGFCRRRTITTTPVSSTLSVFTTNAPSPCDVNDFFCDMEAVCIDKKFVCDGYKDCFGGGDEKKCGGNLQTTTASLIRPQTTKRSPCGINDFLCEMESVCIHKKFVCDGYKDCLGGTDEKKCLQTTTASLVRPQTTKRSPCDVKDFFCELEAVCIDKKFVCDGYKDCFDGDDEKRCGSNHRTTPIPSTTTHSMIESRTTKRLPCDFNDFFCDQEAVCIDKKFVCDGYQDCLGGNDEKKCHISTPSSLATPRPPKTTTVSMVASSTTKYSLCGKDFLCPQESLCIRREYVCDGYKDCIRGDDEKDCSSRSTTPLQISTTSYTPTISRPTRAPCRNDEFFCKSEAKCLRKMFLCDGIVDCSGGYDEANCTLGNQTTTQPPGGCIDVSEADVGATLRKPYSWMALIETTDGRKCSAVLISSEWVLASAVCVRKQSLPDLVLSFPGITGGGRKHNVTLISKPQLRDADADPILIRFDAGATTFQPICISNRSPTSNSMEKCYVITPPSNRSVHQRFTKLLKRRECLRAGWMDKNPPKEIQCIQSTKEGKYCGGVSVGSILICNTVNNRGRGYYLKGIEACHFNCFFDDCPGTFTNLEMYSEWIRKETSTSVTTTTATPYITRGPPELACGHQPSPITLKHPRIIGGMEATPGNWPWALALVIGNRFLCGATLVHRQIALTAGHCIRSCKPQISDCRLVIGGHNIQIDRLNKSKMFPINGIQFHPNFTWPTLHNDLAVVRLKAPAPNNIIPVCYKPSAAIDSHHCYVVGFGAASDVMHFGRGLKQVRVPLIPRKTCMRANWHGRSLSEGELCAGYATGGMDACNGDSGGPLQCWNPNKRAWQLVGIATWGVSCGAAKKPGVYASVNYYRPWLSDTIETLLRS